MFNIRNIMVRNSGRIALAAYAAIWFVGFFLLTGCAGTPITQRDYERGEVTEQQFSKDSAACEMAGDEHRSVDIALWGSPISYNRLFDACMRSKGYAKKV